MQTSWGLGGIAALLGIAFLFAVLAGTLADLMSATIAGMLTG